MADNPEEKDKTKKIEEITLELSPAGEPRMGRVYVNYVQISHNPYEFTVRFCLVPPGADMKKLVKEGTNTIEIPIIIDVMVPSVLMPGFIKALQSNLEKFEKKSEKSLPAETEPTTH